MATKARSDAEEAEVGENILWHRKLIKLMKDTEVPTTVEQALLAMLPLLRDAHDLDEADVRAISADYVRAMTTKLRSGCVPDADKINPEKAAAIYVYTLEEPSIYSICSRAFASPVRLQGGKVSEAVMQCLPFCMLLHDSLKHLPPSYHYKGDVYRGVKWSFPTLEEHSPEAFDKYFYEGKEFRWFEAKSTSWDQKSMTHPQFCGFVGARTIFKIQVSLGYVIHHFSAFGVEERKVLLPMLTQLVVKTATVGMTINKAHVQDRESKHHVGFPDTVVVKQILPEDAKSDDPPPSDGSVMSALEWQELGIAGGGTFDGKEHSQKDCYLMALGIDPKNHYTWYGLGTAGGGTFEGKEHSQKDCYLMTFSIDPRYHHAWCGLGIAGGGTFDGKEHCQKDCYLMALSIDPRYHYAWNGLGDAGGGTFDGKEHSQKDCYLMALSIDRGTTMLGMASAMQAAAPSTAKNAARRTAT
ncbi:unnamed protein product [Polarella glacialis]|uniref:NAD(P)(+)--arginine ADP-ribosyltransferase n=1 Tax=Polarella glacialis TaxID=89957 RepID=A0A813JII9_POLGL|nr:unnamed protein product [Polarella glacialis]